MSTLTIDTQNSQPRQAWAEPTLSPRSKAIDDAVQARLFRFEKTEYNDNPYNAVENLRNDLIDKLRECNTVESRAIYDKFIPRILEEVQKPNFIIMHFGRVKARIWAEVQDEVKQKYKPKWWQRLCSCCLPQKGNQRILRASTANRDLSSVASVVPTAASSHESD